VAVGDGGQIAVTRDGAGWDVDQVLPGGAGFTEVAYGDGVFVAAGADGATAASADGGATWVESGSGGAAARGLVYADGRFFLGDGASIFASSDGVAWSAVNAAPAAPLAVVGSRLIGTDGATIYTSDDGGFTWDAGVAAAGACGAEPIEPPTTVEIAGAASFLDGLCTTDASSLRLVTASGAALTSVDQRPWPPLRAPYWAHDDVEVYASFLQRCYAFAARALMPRSLAGAFASAFVPLFNRHMAEDEHAARGPRGVLDAPALGPAPHLGRLVDARPLHEAQHRERRELAQKIRVEGPLAVARLERHTAPGVAALRVARTRALLVLGRRAQEE
jgi:hypothetical protein